MTAISATPQAATSTRPPSMLVQVTGAPNPPGPVYASNFTTSVDGFAAGASTFLAYDFGSRDALLVTYSGTAVVNQVYTATRAVTGLTVGTTYKVRVYVAKTGGEFRLTAGPTVTAWLSGTGWQELLFTATATSHSLVLAVRSTTPGTTPAYAFDTISVRTTATWGGTDVYRTDANGADVRVREDAGGQDVSAGAMTITDWEAALNGPVTYRVVDGTGAQASIVTGHSEARRNLSLNPRAAAGAGGGWETNDTPQWTVTRGEPVADHPLGVTTAAKIVPQASGSPTIGSINGMDSLGASGTSRGFGLWVKAPYPVTVTCYLDANTAGTTKTTAVAANVWTFCTTAAAGTGYEICIVNRAAGTAAAGDVLLATACMTEAGKVPTSYFDGDTADDGPVMHYWLGPVNGSASVETAEHPELGTWLTLPATAVPSAGAAGAPQCVNVPMVLDYLASAASTGTMHQVIGRPDKIGNPGPLSARSGTLECFELDYAGARELRQLLDGGDVAMLRQPTHDGMDLYLVPVRVDERPQSQNTSPRRWQVSIGYEEVAVP